MRRGLSGLVAAALGPVTAALVSVGAAMGPVVFGLLSAATLPVPLRAQDPPPPADRSRTLGERLPVREITLDNGMRVLLLPREGAPTVSFVMQLAVGGVHEHLGTTGVAHLLEHMLFKGTETIGTTDVEAERRLFERADSIHGLLLELRARRVARRERAATDPLPGAIPDPPARPPEGGYRAPLSDREQRLGAELRAIEDSARSYVVSNELDRIFSSAGARGLNATTTSESTSYFVELPANRAEVFFVLEADRMANPVFREFYTERDVVMEERRMRVESSPGGALYETHVDAAFSVHPYGQPVVGYRSDLETLARSDVARYYRSYYGPNNAVLAVVGSFDPDQVEGWVRRYLGPIPRGERPPPVFAVEPEQRGERRVELVWDAEPALRVGWHVPEAMHPDSPALAVLSSILTGGRTARLHRRLVTEERAATSVYSSMGPGSLYPRLFQIDATPVFPATTADLEAAIYEEIERIAAEGPTAAEVERVRNQMAAADIRRLQSRFGLALQLADSESSFGDWRETFRSTDRLRDVSAADVRRVAGEYFDRANRTVAVLVSREDGA